jgi:flagellar export protein FliJ
MKAFRFNLEAVRTLRQRQEQTAMEQYAQTLALRQQAVNRLAAVSQELTDGWQELRSRLAGGCAASEVAQMQEYHHSLVRRRDECMNALGIAERRVNAAFQAMLAARQQRELVDKYFEKQKARHQRHEGRNEQKLLDDLAGRRGNSILAWTPTEMPT